MIINKNVSQRDFSDLKENDINAGLIIIGNEVLSGRTKDQNLQYLALKLNSIGIKLVEVRVIPDIEKQIISTVNYLRKRLTYVFTTGGIGPTHDDITASSIAKAFDTECERHPEAEKILRSHYIFESITQARLKMAEIPIGAQLLYNPVSKAPGFYIENVYVLPGVPRIMQAICDGFFETLIGGEVTLSCTISTDVPEGIIGTDLGLLQSKYEDVEIGSYPFLRNGKTGTSLVVRHSDRNFIEMVLIDLRELITKLGGVTEEDEVKKSG